MFNQFVYTWKTREKFGLTDNKEGLAIVASSSDSKAFLEKAMRAASPFNSERETRRTAEFVVYSPDFQRHIGVGVSPYGMDTKNRKNKLVHAYIPNEGAYEYAFGLKYPFKREVEEVYLEEVDLNPPPYDYREILQKYNLDEEKLAEFLSKIYPVLFGEEKNIGIILGDGPDVDEDGECARELTYLISKLVPAEECFRRVSYGVYTTANTEIVSFAFTRKEKLCRKNFYLYEKPEMVPEFYQALADSIIYNSLEEYQEFAKEVLTCGASKPGLAQLAQKYLFWKLDHEIPVSSQEFSTELKSLSVRALNNNQERVYLYKYLLGTEQLSENDMKELWMRFLTPYLHNYESLEIDEKEQLDTVVDKVLDILNRSNPVQYKKVVKTLPKGLYMKNVDAKEYWNDIDVENSKEVKEIYDLFMADDALRRKFDVGGCVNYHLYEIWECLFKNMEGKCVIKTHHVYFVKNAFPSNQELITKSVEQMQKFTVDNLDVVNYLRIQQMKEAAKMETKTAEQLKKDCELLVKEFPQFAGKIVEKEWNRVVRSEWMKQRGAKMKRFIRGIRGEADPRSNEEEILRKLEKCKNAISTTKEMLQMFEEEYKKLEKQLEKSRKNKF